MFEKNLIDIKNDLQLHKREKDYLIKFFVNKRLNESLYNYIKDLNRSVRVLSNCSPDAVLKELK